MSLSLKTSLTPALQRLALLLSSLLISACVSKPPATIAAHDDSPMARGIVFNDSNQDGLQNNGEKGLAGVGVSNGVDVVETDSRGRYALAVTDDTMIFVIKPSGWRTLRSNNGIARFYYNHKPAGSPPLQSTYNTVAPTGTLPAQINFPLHQQAEPKMFKLILFGDTQPRNQQEIDYIAHDVVEELVGFDAAFGMTLGDIVFNDLLLLKPLERLVATIGVPWYNVMGNHDINFQSADDRNSDETWEQLYGPNYYSFNYANVHFVVMDNVAWNGEKYHGEFGEQQRRFLQNDLALVPKDKLVVLSMHIPINTVDDRKKIYAILDDHPHHLSFAAHWHRQGNFFLDKKDGWQGKKAHHHLVHATVCGSWWTGLKDENGIPHATMADGAPNGYSIVTFDDTDYSIRFKAARRPADHQMTIFTPEAINRVDASNTQVVVNVFAGSERSTVDMRLGDDGAWAAMDRTPMQDPFFLQQKALEKLLTTNGKIPKEAGRTLPAAVTSPHIWAAPLPENPAAGLQVIHVRTTDMFGQTYTGKRTIRIE